MRESMVRKQIYLPKWQNQALKRLAKQRGVSEAEIIRQALEREAEMTTPQARESQKAMEAIFAFVEARRKHPEAMKGQPVKFNRAELYEERESRWFKPEKGE
jgi:hypothetical protein